MRRRLPILLVVLVLALSLAVGVMRARAASAPGKPATKVIVLLKKDANAGEVLAKLSRGDATGVYRYHIIDAVAATVTPATLAALRADGNVLRVVNDHRVPAPKDPSGAEGPLPAPGSAAKAAAPPVAPLESEAVQLTHAEDAWQVKVHGQSVMGQGVRVGMLDTGTDPTHPDLAPAIEAYRDFTGNGLQDNDGHGTATSSCVAAQGLPVFNPETATSMRVSGMAPMAKVLMAKVIDVDGGWDSEIMRGIQWLVDEKVDIISCSLGTWAVPQNGEDPASLAAQAAVNAGITFVNSEGNEGPGQGTMGSSPDLKNVLAVGASTGNREFSQIGFMVDGSSYKGDQVITWSSRGPNSQGAFRPDIMGFGAYGWALAPMAGDAYGDVGIQEFGGTSMAAPIVAGDLALAECAWKLAHPGETLPPPSYWKNLLASTATDLGYPALDQSSGLANAKAAVLAVIGSGPSMLVSVAADKDNPSSWSAWVKGGASKSTKITVRNTGDASEVVTLQPTAFAVDTIQTITKSITLTADADYSDTEDVTVPAGTDFVQVSITWPSAPDVSIRSAVYDSDGNFLTYAPTYGGYGHLSCCQVSLGGPPDQRPVVKKDSPWQVQIFPRASMTPTADQPVNMKVEFLRRARWSDVTLSRSSISLKPGHSALVRATVTAPAQAGTYFGGITVRNGTTTTTVPVAVRVPVTITNGRGTFAGQLTGSTVEYFGGEFYFYDFVVPEGTTSLAASLTWPDQGNLIDAYLVDPNGYSRDAKGGDLQLADISGNKVPPDALAHTAEQVVWDAPDAGVWQLVVWAPGFSGEDFSEPFAGTVTLDKPTVSPAEWTASAAPGQTIAATFSVANQGPSSLAVYSDTDTTLGGQIVYDNYSMDPVSGSLQPTADGFYAMHDFTLPQDCTMVTAAASWTAPGVLVDLGLYDPTGTDVAESLAPTDLGNAVVASDPMAGLWTLVVAYGDPGQSPPPVDYSITVSYVAPVPLDAVQLTDTEDDPMVVAGGDTKAIRAELTVPSDAQPGDTITGTLDFHTVSDGVQTAGGDRLGSVPISIDVVAP